MTTATISMSDVRDRPGVERVAAWLLLAFVASLQVSIAAANILLALTTVCWVALLAQHKVRPAAPPFFLPLAAYAAITLIASAFSVDPRTSLVDSKQLLLFAIPLVVYEVARGRKAATVVDVIVTVGAA